MSQNQTTSHSRRIVATAALPYANGPIHMGHLLEYLQADFWTRFQKMRGHECLYICADDTHGTPIMVSARNQKITPEVLIAKAFDEHVKDFKEFEVQFDNYSSTNTKLNQELCELIYSKLQQSGHTTSRSVEQLYCQHDKMFLPDRFVKGVCPNCQSPEQYGDGCEKCGATYSPKDLKTPQCSLCGNTPVHEKSENIFFKLNDFREFLQKWVPEHAPLEVANKLKEWLDGELKDWDISRDEPYFGFKIPGTTNKYFYVWVDAPMGYVSSLREWCEKNNKNWQDFWNEKSEIYHFIGKDIVNFHCLFWPAMLKASQMATPNGIFVHGHLTLNGEKMSKSRGNFFSARQYLNHLNPLHLRYYFATKIGPSVDDMDLNFEDYQNRVNAELVGKITNLASRGAQMLTKKMDSQMSTPDAEGLALIESAQKQSEAIAEFYEKREFAKAINQIRLIADDANRYFDEKAPWKTLATDPEATKKVLTTTLNLFRIINIYLTPVLPSYSLKVAELFNEKPYVWKDAATTLTNYKIQDYVHLANRVEADKIKDLEAEGQKMILESQKKQAQSPTATAKAPEKKSTTETSPDLIDFEDFAKIDLRVVKIIEAQEIKEADKLLKLKVDLGNGQTKQIIAGIKSAYKAEDLVGRMTVIVANLKPRQMKFGVSEGMVLAAGAGGKDLFILSPDSGAQAGDKVK